MKFLSGFLGQLPFMTQILMAILASQHRYNTEEDWGSFAFEYFFTYSCFLILLYLFLGKYATFFVDLDIVAKRLGKYAPALLMVFILAIGWTFRNPTGEGSIGIEAIKPLFGPSFFRGYTVEMHGFMERIYQLTYHKVDMRIMEIQPPFYLIVYGFLLTAVSLAATLALSWKRVKWEIMFAFVILFLWFLGWNNGVYITLGLYCLIRFFNLIGWLSKSRKKRKSKNPEGAGTKKPSKMGIAVIVILLLLLSFAAIEYKFAIFGLYERFLGN